MDLKQIMVLISILTPIAYVSAGVLTSMDRSLTEGPQWPNYTEIFDMVDSPRVTSKGLTIRDNQDGLDSSTIQSLASIMAYASQTHFLRNKLKNSIFNEEKFISLLGNSITY